MTRSLTSALLYHGPSLIDDSPIRLVATGMARASLNTKTGAMVQTWIMRADMAPTVAVATGADSAVCGVCPQRPSTGGECYVVTAQAPATIHRSAARGAIPDYSGNVAMVANALTRPLRIGAYGEPTAVPFTVWAPLLQAARRNGWAGYTHRWAEDIDPRWRQWLMASCETTEQARVAESLGWRVFLATDSAPVGMRLAQCPADPARGTALRKCADCKACNGTNDTLRKRAGIWVTTHGARSESRKRGASLEQRAIARELDRALGPLE
jgi:hypothetical protein